MITHNDKNTQRNTRIYYSNKDIFLRFHGNVALIQSIRSQPICFLNGQCAKLTILVMYIDVTKNHLN